MNDDNKKDSLSSMNDLFGTKINKEEPVKKEKIDESKYEDIPEINKAMLPKEDKKNIEEEQLSKKEENQENNEQTEEQEEKTTTKFINEEYVNEKSDEKPLIETPSESENTNGMINELIDIAKNFDFSKLKFNIATIALIISLVGCLFYNLILTIPALLLSLLAYQQAQSAKLDKQSKLIAVISLVLSTVGLISIVMSYISRLLTF